MALFSQNVAPQDSTANRFSVQKTTVETVEDLENQHPFDFQTPSNIKTEVIYDHKTNRYIFQNKIGDTVLGVPFTMTPQEYMKYRSRQLKNSYFRDRNALNQESGQQNRRAGISLFDIRESRSILEDVFGPGGVQIKPQGSVELFAGVKRNVTNNPTLPERSRKRNTFDFDQQIQMNVNAKVGTKIDFNMNYNTEATFNFDSKRIKLAYQGEEDEIIKNIEAGNVSMTTSNQLINGGAALFGIKTDLQFGKLKVNALLSQQESESKTVNSRGGVQTTPFEFGADQYDENRHFFLAHYFRDNYDNALSKLPFVQSAVSITRIEVWITNKRGNYDQARNILAFADLAEHEKIKNPFWTPLGNENIPYNEANTLYPQMITTYSAARDISQTANVFPPNIVIGQDYEKIESARLLNSSEYSFHQQLGYISLNMPLQADEVLAVAYEFTYNGKAYQVGEFSNNIGGGTTNPDPNATGQGGALVLKLLKTISLSPQSYTWDLMMKNIYSMGYSAFNVQKERFKLNITYQSDTTGVYLNYIPEGDIQNQLLLRVMSLDRLNSKNDPYPDGIFDFLEGYTVKSQNGRIIFPVIEPFGSHLRKVIGNDAIADKYVFQELYDSTLTVARQIPEKNKFRMNGEYKGSSGSAINLNATNVTRGSVRVTAAGVVLTEGTDYTVDYISGTVNIINQSILDAGTPVSVSLENQSFFNMQRKTMLGLNLTYDFSKDFAVGATIMHLYEKPLTMKTTFGDESVKNTLWGANATFKKQSYALTNLIDKLPFVEATAPSQLIATAEFAQMLPGHYKNKYTGGYSYLDDFESSTSGIDLRSPYSWTLASTPFNNTSTGLFPEAALSNNIEYGNNRAQIAWFYIDGLFTRRNSSLTPEHIKNDKEQLSNHFVREIYEREIFPNKEAVYGEPPTIPVLNISYYPNERGPYNLDPNVNDKGNLLNPKQRWGGMTRKMDTRDFETANIEYVEFWLMDPFVYNDGTDQGGDLYFNLGEISEDVLKDGKKFFENGLPVNNDESAIGYSVWGKYPLRQSTVYAFDNSLGEEARRKQDVGLNGLNSDEEKAYPTYVNYLNEFTSHLSPETLANMQNDNHSPINDPGGDKFRHYRGPAQDQAQLSILNRYKYFNGTEGNSLAPENNQLYSTASRTTPDVEDIDNDNTLNENESYYQYKIQLRPENMVLGTNYIVDKREVTVTLRNGELGRVNWYQFKIPLRDYQSKVGNIQGFNNIRFFRMFLTDFEKPVFLRFATLELVRSEWRTYTQDLEAGGAASGLGRLDISTVNIEENGDRSPINYILPPGVTRILDPSQPQLRQQNEQSISLKVDNLDPEDSRSIYKNSMFDLRRYKRLQMFVHAEKLNNSSDNLQDDEMTVFLRVGSDYRNNYYEYEIPLKVTPPGVYSSRNPADQEAVWRPENMFDFPLELFTDLKLKRNAERRKESGVTYLTPYSEQDPDKPANRITITGNPSLAEVKVMMVGVRNKRNINRSAEVWINELRLSEFDEKGGWAAQGNVNLTLSDLGSVNVSGRKETVGFGSLDQSLLERRNDDFTSVNVAMNVELGRFLPPKAKISAPLYYSYSNQTVAPQYDPLNQDILLSESLDNAENKMERDSINNLALTKTTNRSLSLSNVKVNIKSKNPMPYDPANFSFGYSYNENKHHDPEVEYNTMLDQRLQAIYSYTPFIKPFEPFKNIKSNSGWLKLIKYTNFNYLPNNIQVSSILSRNYQETQLRDLNAYLSGMTDTSNQYLSFSQNFIWDRDFSLLWDLTKNLKTSFRSGTIAEIEEPYLQVNKKLNPDDYEIWKDSVMHSIKELGKPLNYEQSFDVTYTVPFAQIPILDWINTNAVYNSRYKWDRGAVIPDANIGNILQNELGLTINNRLNLVQFYDKIEFLKKTNQRFSGPSSSLQLNNPKGGRSQASKPKADPPKKRYTQSVQLSLDSNVVVAHKLDSRKLTITARKDGKQYVVKYKRLDKNRIAIENRDSVKIDLNILAAPSAENTPLYNLAQYTARGLMMVRNISVNIGYRTRTDIPGFSPMVGDMFGQTNTSNGLVPGMGFAFGLEGGVEFIEKAMSNNWLTMNENNISPAIYNQTKNIRLEATLEPFKGLKIDLNGLYEDNRRTEIQYMFQDMPMIFGGSYAISTITLGSAFEKSNAANDYFSKSFNHFLENRAIIASRLREKYQNSNYPNSGFISETMHGNQPFDPSIGDVNPNSADVLIPAFLAAYSGKSANNIGLTAFPDLFTLLPNWDISYNLLNSLPFLGSQFKSFVLTHKYVSQYRVGAFSSFLNWVPTNENSDLGYIRDVLTGSPIPSSPYDISAVSLMESFTPLIEARGILHNNLTVNLRFNKTRAMNLNISSYQLVETSDNDIVIGLGYRVPDFNRVIGFGSNSTRERSRPRSRKDEQEKTTQTPTTGGFNNDLNIRVDVSYKNTQALIRKIEEQFTQATSGVRTTSIKVSADYAMSKSLTLRAFFDKIINTPLVSSSSYPTANTNVGLSLRFNLTQ